MTWMLFPTCATLTSLVAAIVEHELQTSAPFDDSAVLGGMAAQSCSPGAAPILRQG